MRANVDHIAVERRINGDTSVTLNDDEKNAAIVATERTGMSVAATATLVGCHQNRVREVRETAGLMGVGV